MARLTIADYDRFVIDLAGLVRARMPLPQGLRDLSKTFRSGRLRDASLHVAARLEAGEMLSDALASSPVKMPDGFISLIRCGEISGDPYSLLEFSMEHARRVQRHHSAIITAIYYPALVLVGTLGVFLLLAHTVTPRAERFLDSNSVLVNPYTELFFTVSSFFGSSVGTILTILIGATVLACFLAPAGRDWLMRQMCALPGFRKLVELSDCAVLMKFLAVMLPRGVPLPDVLMAAQLAVVSRATRATLGEMNVAATQGRRVSQLLGGAMPATASYLFRRSEENGNVAETCAGIANYCEERFEVVSQRTSALLEPILLLILGIVLGAIILALYLPIFSMPRILQ